ncbi:hypothetical protein Scep_013585 [Stephania cephalantha]|uniref:25S rRNA (uridine-N(3))-methyltransferase BMT5-like domain-containing protein n=1 Tax=Stephania cephalantha TaxID=152367 RepID=A0AAP0JJK5_9MAGN
MPWIPAEIYVCTFQNKMLSIRLDRCSKSMLKSPHSSVDDPKEVNPLSIVVVDNGKQSTPFRGDFEELKKFVDVISRPIEEIKQEIWIKHYCSSHKILLVGEDFLKKNYGQAMSNIQSLRSRGCKVIHKVNATEMAGHKKLNVVKYDRIVYNFPHAGFSSKESVTDEIRCMH